MKQFILLILAVLGLAVSPLVKAQSGPVDNSMLYTPNVDLSTLTQNSTAGTVGGIFYTPYYYNAPVNWLGYYDKDGDGLANSHKVTIWDHATGLIVAEVTVPAGTSAPLINGYRWVQLPSTLTLTYQSYYDLAAQADGVDTWGDMITNNSPDDGSNGQITWGSGFVQLGSGWEFSRGGVYDFNYPAIPGNQVGNSDSIYPVANMGYNLTVPCGTVTLGGLAGGFAGEAYSGSVAASSGIANYTPPYTYTLTSGSLPPGLLLDTNSGAITGTPTAAGSSSFTISANDPYSCGGSSNYSVTITYDLLFTPNVDLSTGTQNGTVGTVGGIFYTPYYYNAQVNWLGYYDKDGDGLANSHKVTIWDHATGLIVAEVTVPAGTSAPLINGFRWVQLPSTLTLTYQSYYDLGAQADGVDTWGDMITNNSPDNGNNGQITWSSQFVQDTPGYEFSRGGVYDFNYPAIPGNQVGNSDSIYPAGNMALDLPIPCGNVTLGGLSANGTTGASYNGSVAASSGVANYTPPYIYAVTSGSLPAGLLLNTNSGAIAGTPTATGPSSFTISATDPYGCGGSSNYSLTIASGCPTFTLTVPAAPAKGKKVNLTLTASGGVVPYHYTNTSGALPAGLILTNATGHIGGTATNYGSYTFAISVTDSNGCSTTTNITWVVTKNGGDTKGPTVTIQGPKNNAVLQTNAPINVFGKVADDVLTTNVVYWLNTPATGPGTVATSFTATNWNIAISSPAAVNTVIVRGTDLSGNTGKLATVTFNYGTHSFLGQAGTYYGLFSPAGVTNYEDSGFVRVKVAAVANKLPSYSAKLYLGGKASGFPASGTFTLDGTGTLKKTIARTGLADLGLVLNLPLNNSGTLTGTVSSVGGLGGEAAFSSALSSYLGVTNKVGTAGATYDNISTIVSDAPDTNYGYGYSSLTVVTGKVTLAGGKLANGQSFKGITTYLGAGGQWPLFIQNEVAAGAYKSMVLGWLHFTGGTLDTNNSVVWLSKGGLATYKNGFTNTLNLTAEPYDANIGSFLVTDLGASVSNYTVYFGNNSSLTTNIANPITISNSAAGKNKFYDKLLTTNKTFKANTLVLGVVPKTGLFTGSSFKGDGETKWSVGGAVLQQSHTAAGYFIETMDAAGTNSGTFFLQ